MFNLVWLLKHQSKLGYISIGLGVLFFIIIIMSTIKDFESRQIVITNDENYIERQEESALDVQSIYNIAGIITLIGFIIGIYSLFLKKKGKVASIIGIIINGFIIYDFYILSFIRVMMIKSRL